MAKTNFTKVEEALTEGLGKLQKERLLEEADAAQGKKRLSDEEERRVFILKMHRDLKKLHHVDKGAYEAVGIEKKLIKRLIKKPELLLKEDWSQLKRMRTQIESYRKDLKKRQPQLSDEQIIEGEQARHLKKRFNVNEDWLPLD